MREYRLEIIITAESHEEAEMLREEIVGAIEDNHESGSIEAEASVSDLQLWHSPEPPHGL